MDVIECVPVLISILVVLQQLIISHCDAGVLCHILFCLLLLFIVPNDIVPVQKLNKKSKLTHNIQTDTGFYQALNENV